MSQIVVLVDRTAIGHPNRLELCLAGDPDQKLTEPCLGLEPTDDDGLTVVRLDWLDAPNDAQCRPRLGMSARGALQRFREKATSVTMTRPSVRRERFDGADSAHAAESQAILAHGFAALRSVAPSSLVNAR